MIQDYRNQMPDCPFLVDEDGREWRVESYINSSMDTRWALQYWDNVHNVWINVMHFGYKDHALEKLQDRINFRREVVIS